MDEHLFHIVDVFAESPYSGNQLAVFVNGHLYSEAEMQRLAKEMNFSESTFIFPRESRDGHYRVRIFTPAAELPFAGHPTLGTAFIIATTLAGAPVTEVTLDLNAGRIPVQIAYAAGGGIDRLTMSQLQPRFGRTLPAAAAAAILGLPASAIDARFPAQEVSTGVGFLIVPVRTLDAMHAIRVDTAVLSSAVAGGIAHAVLAFCPETDDAANRLHVRVFVPAMGVLEDPATGSANGCLVGYLLEQRYLGGDDLDLRAEQGIEMGRPSVLYLAGQHNADGFAIHVGGKVQHIATGRLAAR